MKCGPDFLCKKSHMGKEQSFFHQKTLASHYLKTRMILNTPEI